MFKKRMTGSSRKQAIIQAALPLFAHQGFAATTTKHLAEAANVSEALLYRHFPSKESLYAEIKGFGSQGEDAELIRLLSLPPSTSTLACIVYGLLARFVLGRGGGSVSWDTRIRLMLQSCLEDGSFVRFLFTNYFGELLDHFERSLAEAKAVGHLVDSPVSIHNGLLFTHHLAIMIGCMHLPPTPAVDYDAPRQEVLRQAMWFTMRGLGFRDGIVAQYLDLDVLERRLQGALSSASDETLQSPQAQPPSEDS